MGNSESARYSDGKTAFAQPNRSRFAEAARLRSPELHRRPPARPRGVDERARRLRTEPELRRLVRVVAEETALGVADVLELAGAPAEAMDLRRRARAVLSTEETVLAEVGLERRRLTPGERDLLRSAAVSVVARTKTPENGSDLAGRALNEYLANGVPPSAPNGTSYRRRAEAPSSA